MNKLIIGLLVDVDLLLALFENLMNLSSHLKIEVFKLPDADTWCCSRILLNFLNFSLSIVDFVVGFDVVIDGKNLSQSCFIKHFVYPFRNHAQEFLFIWVSYPEYDRIWISQLSCKFLIIAADLFPIW